MLKLIEEQKLSSKKRRALAMSRDQQLDDWIREIEETSEQLGRLADQLREMERENLQGMIGRIEHLQTRLDQIRNFIDRLNNNNT